MYTYVQRPVCKKENTATYIHMGGVSNAYSRIRTARVHVHGWVGADKLHRRRVHGEPTGWVRTECVVVFIGRAWTEQAMETRPGVPQNGGNRPPTVGTGSCSSGGVWRTAKWRKRTSYGRNGGPVDREGCGVPQNERNRPPTVETGVLLIGRGVAYRKTDETDLLRSKRGSC